MTVMNPILAEFQGKPAFLSETHSALFEACATKVAEKVDFFDAHAGEYTAGAESFWDSDGDSFMSAVRPYRVRDGILTIPVRGILRNRFPYQFGSWATGYEYIWEAMKRGVEDSSVKGIALHINSIGGAVPGLLDLADRMYEMRGQKPIKALVDEMAASAAYCIASCADDITVTRTSDIGSIGVIGVHMEASKRLKNEGIAVTFIRSKPFKGEGGSKEPLRPETQARMQADVDELHTQFVAIVARNRSMDTAKVDATDAVTFMGEKGVEIGLADAVAPFDDALTAFAASVTTTWKGAGTMADKNQADVIALEDHNTAIASAKAEGVTEGKTTGATEERARINAILASEEGKDRPQAALSAALKTGMSVEEATDFLSGLPKEAVTPPETDGNPPADPKAGAGAGAPAGMLSAAMGGTPNPQVGAETGGDEKDDKDGDAELLSMIASAGLSGFKATTK